MPARIARGISGVARSARGWIDRSLGAQLVAILTGVGLLGSVAITLLLAIVITPGFDRLEIEAAAAQRDRVAATLAEIGERTVAAAARARGRSAATGVDAIYPAGARRLPAWLPAGTARLAYVVGDGRLAIVARAEGSVAVRFIDEPMLMERIGFPVEIVAGLAGADAVRDGSLIRVAIPLTDSDGGTAGSLRLSMPRDLSKLGQRMLMLAVGGSTLLLLIVLAVLRRSITALVLGPLGRLEAQMQAVRATGTLAALPTEPRGDEIGGVTASFNAMIAQLADLSEQLKAQSYRLGQSESAVAMIHNVRNALTPVSTILSQGLAQPPPVELELIARALSELADDAVPAARRRKLTAFVAAAFEQEQAARTERVERLEVARDSMRHALAIIGRQQADAQARPHLAPCDLGEIVAANAAIARFAGALPVTLDLPEDMGWAIASRVVLSQVVGNLLANAVEAIAATGRAGRIGVTIDAHGDRLKLTIADNGEGFDEARAGRLFQRGFSTRTDKAGGLGLHWCANAVNAMGGSLTLESDGPGLGARAILTLRAAPLDQAGSRAAA
ncbi:histidine kinase [Sphingomonas spermidinifaciens]|uniref:histidine kinase n=1 Tax=Sphingomonas spermidinifaciens TaxID=1141889 RepID=A0A2A4B5P6_9SPHN|nr:sensor histidine kinase [Sphingomonas spermidinifaciens]PCD03109.1 histidine kinase [Sphingomonas spermidinifaciens]